MRQADQVTAFGMKKAERASRGKRTGTLRTRAVSRMTHPFLIRPAEAESEPGRGCSP